MRVQLKRYKCYFILLAFNSLGGMIWAQPTENYSQNELFLKARDTMLFDITAFCEYVEEGLKRYNVSDRSVEKRRGLAYKALCYAYDDQFLRSKYLADSILRLQDKDHLSRAYAFGALGTIDAGQHKFHTSTDYYLKALEEAEGANLLLEKGMIYNALAFNFYTLEVFDKSISYAEKSLEIGERLANRGLILNALERLHQSSVGKEDSMQNIKSIFYKKRLDSLTNLMQDQSLSMISNMNTGWMFLDNENYDSAETYYVKALELDINIEDTLNHALSLGNLGKIYLATNKIDRAKPVFAQLEKLLPPIEGTSEILFIIYQKAQFEFAKGNYQKGFELLDEYIARDQEFYENDVRQDLVNSEAKYEHLKQRSEIEKQQLEINQRTTQRNLALTLGGLLLTLGVLSFVWFRNKSFQKEIAQNQLLMQTENNLITSRMQMMRAQMNPHFLFNSLNSIKHFILQKTQDESAQYISDFAKLMRLNLQNSTEILIPLSREISFLKQYLLMEQMRFKHPFEVKWDIQEEIDLDSYRFPPMLIQPYIENAIWHGLRYRKFGGGHGKESRGAPTNLGVESDGRKGSHEIESRGAPALNGLINIHIGIINKDKLVCIIQDNGVGRVKSEEIKSRGLSLKKSMGTQITEDRIAMTNQILDADIRVHTEDLYDDFGRALGTRVTIYIPYMNES